MFGGHRDVVVFPPVVKPSITSCPERRGQASLELSSPRHQAAAAGTELASRGRQITLLTNGEHKAQAARRLVVRNVITVR